MKRRTPTPKKKRASKKRAKRLTPNAKLRAEVKRLEKEAEDRRAAEGKAEADRYRAERNARSARDAANGLVEELNKFAQERTDSISRSYGVPVRVRITLYVGDVGVAT